MTDDTDNLMNETMDAIEAEEPTAILGKRENLEAEISNLEKNIVSAQEIIDEDLEENTYTPVSPEQANEKKKNIIFLKKDLEAKKSERKQLDE